MSRSRSAWRQKEIAAASATRASEAATCPSETWIEVLTRSPPRAGPASTARPSSSRTTQSPSRRACSGSWLTRTSEMSSSRRSSASVASIASRAAWSSAEVGSSSSSTSGSWASARASIARCCSPTESLATSRSANSGSRPASRRQRSASSSLAGEPRRVAEVRLDRPLEQRRQLRHQRDLAPQRERVVRGERRAAVGDRAAVGVGEPVEQPQQRRLAAARGPDDRRRPRGDLGADRVEDRATAAGEADIAQLEQHGAHDPTATAQEASRAASGARPAGAIGWNNPGR